MRGKLRAGALPTSPLAAPIVACVELMRIIPDNGSEYSDILVTVKRYLLDGATSAFCAIGFSLVWSFSLVLLLPSPSFRGSRNWLGTCSVKLQFEISRSFPLPDAHGEG